MIKLKTSFSTHTQEADLSIDVVRVTTKTLLQKSIISIFFSFLENSKTRNLNFSKGYSIHTYHINALIRGKQAHLVHLLQDVFLQLQNPILQKKKNKNFIISKRDKKKIVLIYQIPFERENNMLLIFFMIIVVMKSKFLHSKTYSNEL
jgi:hypothetical protein